MKQAQEENQIEENKTFQQKLEVKPDWFSNRTW